MASTMEEGVRGAGLIVSSDRFANAVDAGAGDGNFEEELRGENVVLHVGVRELAVRSAMGSI